MRPCATFRSNERTGKYPLIFSCIGPLNRVTRKLRPTFQKKGQISLLVKMFWSLCADRKILCFFFFFLRIQKLYFAAFLLTPECDVEKTVNLHLMQVIKNY